MDMGKIGKRREGMRWLVEFVSKGEMWERGGEIVYRLVE